MGHYIEVTSHALERARERGGPLPVENWRARERIASEVVDALADGRVSTRLPSEAVRDGSHHRTVGHRKHGGGRDRAIRYAWPPGLTHVYVLRRTPLTTTVLTVLPTADTRACG